MVKIVVEVSEDLIRELTNPENRKSEMEEGGKKALGVIMDILALSSLENRMEKGETEFTLKGEDFTIGTSEKEKSFFSSTLGSLAALLIKSAIEEKKEEEEDEK